MAFSDSIAAIPFNASAANATGILAPLVRSMGHVIFACAAVADENVPITVEEVQRELEHAAGHLSSTTEETRRAPVSTQARTRINAYIEAVRAAHNEYPDWSEDEQVTNLKNLANRPAALAAFLDGECIGIGNADPGTSL